MKTWPIDVVAFILLILAFAAMCIDVVQGQAPVDTDLLIAQCIVGEEGFTRTDGHAAIPHKLAKQHARKLRRYPTLTLADQTRGYCKALSGGRTWVRSLAVVTGPLSIVPEPRGWPAGSTWVKHEPKWRAILALVRQWRAGKLKDPCPTALHWGGDMDKPCKGCVAVQCGDSKNTFYAVGP